MFKNVLCVFGTRLLREDRMLVNPGFMRRVETEREARERKNEGEKDG